MLQALDCLVLKDRRIQSMGADLSAPEIKSSTEAIAFMRCLSIEEASALQDAFNLDLQIACAGENAIALMADADTVPDVKFWLRIHFLELYNRAAKDFGLTSNAKRGLAGHWMIGAVEAIDEGGTIHE